MKHVYRSQIDQLKADHLLRTNQTTDDDRYYREPTPLTDKQKEILLWQEEERKKQYAIEIEFRKQWMEKYYADKTNRDLVEHKF